MPAAVQSIALECQSVRHSHRVIMACLQFSQITQARVT